jgi:GTP:adenosylcobinamide-phosphate guanylyltransferase
MIAKLCSFIKIKIMNIIIQAGGKGSRLRHHTWNKPKCLLSVNNKPLLYNYFDQFPDDKFYVIGDYLFEVLETYLDSNKPNVDVSLVKTSDTGTCSGIADVLDKIDNEDPIILVWGDLYFSKVPDFKNLSDTTLFTTSCFVSRFKVMNDKSVVEQSTQTDGVTGVFYFQNKDSFVVPPKNGEFLKFFINSYPHFDVVNLDNIDELGDFSHYENIISKQSHCRFFNQVTINENFIEKKCINSEFKNLIDWEQNWYDSLETLKFNRIPKVLSKNPYQLEKINGNHAFDLDYLSEREKAVVLIDMLDLLDNLHKKTEKPFDKNESEKVYFDKTYNRIEKIHSLLPLNKSDSFTINGKKCKNLFKNFNTFILDDLKPFLISSKFTVIHGDPTFSNSLVDKYLRTWLIDPRGYFAEPGVWGDPFYDFAKVYFSAIGNYDKYNRKKFKLYINDSSIEIMMEKNIFEDVSKSIFSEYFGSDLKKIEIIHALIWIGMSGYAIDDLDSILAAHYLGLYWLENIYGG